MVTAAIARLRAEVTMPRIDPRFLIPGPNIREVGDVSDLIASIKEHGVKVALQVFEDATLPPGHYRILEGHRRRAAAMAVQAHGTAPVPYEIVDAPKDEEELVYTQYIINTRRRALNPIEQAKAIERMLGFGRDARFVGDEIGESEEWVIGRLGLLSLVPEAQAKVARLELSPTAAAELVSLKPEEQQAAITGKGTVVAIRRKVQALRSTGVTVAKGRPLPRPTVGEGAEAKAAPSEDVPMPNWGHYVTTLTEVVDRSLKQYDDPQEAAGGVTSGLVRWLAANFQCLPLEG